MEIDKDVIKQDLIEKSNDILKKYNEPYVVDHIAIMNTSQNINFLGNMRVMVEDSVKKIREDLEEAFKDYEILKIRDRKVVPCCAPPYVHISFNITINK
ncbi:MAG: hypothetical protein Q4P18_07380 [Methanobrevibacter sp.]|uniref:hypothetical protein n=1 Tax=Methanobrevibacter sp. TaxID=66852 RepID=UPI0026DEF5D7|nr:hypothetical protein [Methanobrevibacter sp.]MDO5849340.1 hypothetical protein [Methanobrevibacter sp.]